MLDAQQLSRVRLIAGLYSGENNQSWIMDDEIQVLSDFIGANLNGVYDTDFDPLLAIECLRVVLARGVAGERKPSFQQRIVELRAHRVEIRIASGDSATVGQLTEEIADRQAADRALGLRIDGKQDSLPGLSEGEIWTADTDGNIVAAEQTGGGGADQQAREGVAENKAAASRNAGNIASEITNRQMGDQAIALRVNQVQTRSDDGDEIGVETITQPIQLLNLFVSQETNNNAAWVYFTVDVSEGHMGVQHTYKAGDLAYFAPRNIIGKTVANLMHPHDFTFSSADDTDKFAAAVRSNANADRTRLIIATATYTAFTGGNEYSVRAGDIWAVYARSTTPIRFIPLEDLLGYGGYSNDRMSIVPVNGLPGIDSDINLDGNYWLNDPDVARGIDISQATRWQLNIVGSDDIITERTRVQEVDPWTPSKSIQSLFNISDAEEANVKTALASTPGRVRFALSVYNVNVRILLRIYEMPINAAFVVPGGTPQLTQAQQIGLLSIHTEPSIIPYSPGGLEAALQRTIRLAVANPEILEGDIWVQGSIDGQPILARRKWSNATGSLPFVISQQLARSIGQNPELDVRLSFYDAANAGNLVEELSYGVDLLPVPRPLRQSVVANSAATEVDVDDGVNIDLAMQFNTTLTFTGGENGLYVTVHATQDSTGSRTLMFAGSDRGLSTAANSLDYLLFQRRGNTWLFLGILKAVSN